MKEIKTNDGKKGGWLKGKRHNDKNGNPIGGIKAIVVDTGKPVELEGGEVIINREASKKYWKELSRINQSAGNGVAIGPPADSFDEDPSEEYEKGGKIEFNANHVPNKYIYKYAEKIKNNHPEIWKLGGNIFGNEAFENLSRVSKRGYWLDSEEWMYIKWRAYVARHKQDFRIEGVVAMLKWVDKVDKGWAYMKNLIESEIADKKEKGGQLIKRADGSYSKHGLWDSIRENAGSGKKPTKEMLEQEAKIKSEKYDLGGEVSKYAFVESTTDSGKKIFKIFNHVPSHTEVFEYYQKTKDTKGNPITIIESSIRVQKMSGFNRAQFLEKANKIAQEIFNSEIKKPNELMFLIDTENFNVKEFEATLKSNEVVKISVVDGVIFMEPVSKMDTNDSEKFHLGGDMSKHLAPNGKPSNLNHEQWHLVRTPEFKAWFGDWEKSPESASQVIDENGEPMVCYHGSNKKNIDIFDNEKIGSVQYSDWGPGIYFTPNKHTANYYSNEALKKIDTEYNRLYDVYEKTKDFVDLKAFQNRGRELFNNENTIVYSCFLNIKKPRTEYVDSMNYTDPFLSENAKMDGKDGVFIKTSSGRFDEIVVFESNQIKLADGTNTTFDGNNPDIRFKDGGPIELPNCIDFIKKSEAIRNNGYYFEFKNLFLYVNAYDVVVPKIDSLVLITYNSGGQKGVNAIDTINSIELANNLAKLLGVEISLARILVHEQMLNSKRFDIGLLDEISNKNIVVADRDRIVCTSILKEQFRNVQIGSEKFMQWYIDWNKSISDKMNIYFSLPNKISPFKENNIVILDVFEKIDQNIDAKKYLNKIIEKADEYGVTIYLEPIPRYKHFIEYYQKFGFKLTSDKNFMKRLPNNNQNILFEKGGDIDRANKNLIYYESSPRHAKAYGFDSKKPLYVQHLNVPIDQRESGIGTNMLKELETYAENNNNDLIFGHIAQKSKYGKKNINDLSAIKSWFEKRGFMFNEQNNDFYKLIKPTNKENSNFEKGGATNTDYDELYQVYIYEHNEPVKVFESYNINEAKNVLNEQKRLGKKEAHIQYSFAKGGNIDQKDSITMDIPLLIRTLELSREDIHSDVELHQVVENLLQLKNKPVLTMDDYEYIANVKHKHIDKMKQGGQTQMEKEKIHKVMHEFKEGELHSGSKHGPLVTDRNQAIAIALSESRKLEFGGNIDSVINEIEKNISSDWIKSEIGLVDTKNQIWKIINNPESKNYISDSKERQEALELIFQAALHYERLKNDQYSLEDAKKYEDILRLNEDAFIKKFNLANYHYNDYSILTVNFKNGDKALFDLSNNLTRIEQFVKSKNNNWEREDDIKYWLNNAVRNVENKPLLLANLMSSNKEWTYHPKGMTKTTETMVDTKNETETSVNLNVLSYRNPYELNRAIEKLLDSKGEERDEYSSDEISFIGYYSGYGGLEKQGKFEVNELKGLLYEYFTPDAVVQKMWGLAYKYGYGTIADNSVFEPSTGVGAFIKYVPDGVRVAGNEINKYSAKICRILYPNANITLQPFEKNFIKNNLSIKDNISTLPKYSMLIGNPPYGELKSKYIGMGEDKFTTAQNWIEYFIVRGLDMLHSDGLLIYIVGAEQRNGGTLFLDSKMSKVKQMIFDKAELLDAYRLPVNIFERTGVSSEILVFKKR